ncbi:CvfB family protein [Desulfospira joergensenii]|uniref:CvfB family protein n=1 Tax=Desulfospira joergensenii TaxID=53329 RepID=UPI0003B5A7CC|nr:S1-like domain-containing RNA-binding protein [Desulfospira joergensenii]
MPEITDPWKSAGESPKKGQKRSSSRQSHPFLAQDHEAVVGQFQELPVENLSDYGVYLSFGRDRVLLPNKYVPEGITVGEKIRVFVHTDSEDRPVATTLEPAGVVGDIVALEVKDTAPFGIFMDWGLEKDLLVPRSEQQGRMEPGETHLVKICLDKATQRIYGTTLMREFCSGEAKDLAPGEAVDLIIHSITPIGYTALINRICPGMLYKNETFEDLSVGDQCRGYILKVREDKKVDLTLKQPGYASVEDSAQKILEVLRACGGFSPCHDKSRPEEIQASFSMSKKEFKRAVGSLYKQGRITLDKAMGIRLK